MPKRKYRLARIQALMDWLAADLKDFTVGGA